MSDPSQQCPSVWQEITTPHRVCGRRSTTGGSCEGLNYPTGSEQYNQVCGRIIGYQIGGPDFFVTGNSRIDSWYVDGGSVIHGSPRQHIWTFATGIDESGGLLGYGTLTTCPCITGSTTGNQMPSFVGQNYFCESGLTWFSGGFHPNGDPLWDG